MKPYITLDAFTGPFDLLLTLLEEEKLDITTIALSQVTEQFLARLREAEALPAEELADFLVVASRLLYLKSSLVLKGALAQDEEGALASQLKLYKAYFDASKELEGMLEQGRYTFFRDVRPALEELRGFHPPPRTDVRRVHAVMVALVEYAKPLLALPKVALARVVSIQERIRAIEARVSRAARAYFHEFTKDVQGKGDIIVNFLALLELVKQKSVAANQEAPFGDILVKRVVRREYATRHAN